MQECDLCGEKYSPSEKGDDRYCHQCQSDPFRLAAMRIYEIIGIPHHVFKEIRKLNAKIQDQEQQINSLKLRPADE